MRCFAMLLLLLHAAWIAAQQPPPAPVEPGILLGYTPPVYPAEAKRSGIDGVVYLIATIGQDGAVSGVGHVSGPIALQQAAIDAATRWTYSPFRRNGDPVAVEVEMAVCFELARPLRAPCSPESKTGLPIRVSGGVMQGAILWKSIPVYPPEARSQHVSGAVVCHVIIGKDGRVEHIETISGPELLRASFMDTFRRWVYRPFLVDGEPVTVDTTVTMTMQFGGN